MNRFQKLAALTLATALGLVTIGVIVRATDSGLGCPDWPLCHGQLVPSLGDPKAWIEWIHRTVAVVIGFEILGLAFLAIRDYRDRRSILWPSLAAVGLVGFQAWLGRETVRLGNSGESVTAHLAAALHAGRAAGLPDRPGRLPGPDRRPGRQPAVHAPRRVRRGPHVRPAAVRVARDRHVVRARLPGLAADGRDAVPGRDRRDVGAHPPPLGRRDRRARRRRPRGRRLADPARAPDARPAVRRGRRALRDPGRRRRGAGPDPPGRVDPDPPSRPRCGHLGDAGRPDRHELLHRPGQPRGGPRPDGRRRPRRHGPRRPHQGRHRPRLHRADQAADHRAAAGDDRAGHGPRHARPAGRGRRRRTGPTGARWSSGR